MALLPPSERAAVLRYYHVRDAKMSLASSFIKHVALAHLLPSLSWHDTCITRDPATTKPIFTPPDSLQGTLPAVSFNVTHQAGIVALLASRFPAKGPHVDVGVDIVCTSERRSRDLEVVLSDDSEKGGDGWARFVDMHSDVFSARETAYLKHHVISAIPGLVTPSPANRTAEAVVDAKLRAFYALWALREAYVKLTGDALLAAWLKDLEFREFRPVAPTAGWNVPAREDGGNDEGDADADADGHATKAAPYGAQVINKFDIYLEGKRVDDVNMSLRAMGSDFMICSAVRTLEQPEVGLALKLRPYRALDLHDMLDFAESKMEESKGSWP